ncbi:CoA-binding protein [Robertkochia solimangrovi]|uniref:CoA-binding protein n=1 Tax=Robertkochia solimangrovi TaxID=2213046 RepID=UPI00117F9602|nr:CoA-binding protein [Robertkochia solimangrovi]TRZ41799.1 CoA-binding protein [Robertkochia solimangrovi]
MKKTLVIGASDNPSRYSYLAVQRLSSKGFPVYALGRHPGKINGIEIDTGTPSYPDVHTVTLYINPSNQKELYEYLTGLNPTRVIFNPGTENPDLAALLQSKGVETIAACTLVMLGTGQY